MIESSYSQKDRLDAAKASPEAVANHDKEKWLSLFARQAVVEDPVGSAPHWRGNGRGNVSLDRFYETFIAPNTISFDSHMDIVTNDMVVRDVTIEISSSSGAAAHVNAYVFYELTEEDYHIKITRLAAYWELMPMVKQVIGSGLSGLQMMISLGFRMLRIQGLSGVLGYMKGFRGVGRRGKRAVEEFVNAVNACACDMLTDTLEPDAKIEFPTRGSVFTPSTLSSAFEAPLTVSSLISAGLATSCHFEIGSDGVLADGVALFEFNTKSRRIERARFFIHPSKGAKSV